MQKVGMDSMAPCTMETEENSSFLTRKLHFSSFFFLLPFYPGVHVSTQSRQPIDPMSWAIDEGRASERSSRLRINQPLPAAHNPIIG
jgi:hypothetical protein